jgi:tetratricopeptide (TPR) repeat protein
MAPIDLAAEFADKHRSSDHLLNILRQQTDRQPAYSLLLGAGASASSGVRTAREMIAEWREQLYARDRSGLSFKEWLSSQPWHDSPEEYSVLFEALYDTPSQRRAYIERALERSKPGWGYAFLSRMLSSGVFSVVFTTNFDDLIAEACWTFGSPKKPIVCAHDSSVSGIRLSSHRPKVIKLHGDYLYDGIKNTRSELQSLEGNMRAKFAEFSEHQGLIVSGYSGNDSSVMDVLDALARSPKAFRDGIYWCVRRGDQVSARVRQLARNDRVYLVETLGFDELMSEVAEALDLSLPFGVLSPHIVAYEETRHLLKTEPQCKCPSLVYAYHQVNERHDRANKILRKAGIASEVNRSLDEMIGDLKNEAVPYHEALRHFDRKEYKEAAKVFSGLSQTESSTSFSMQCWEYMIENLILSGNKAQAIEHIRRPPPEQWTVSMHFIMRSYYALLLLESKIAIQAADTAISINTGAVPAYINRAMANKMLGRTDAFKKDIGAIRQHRGSSDHHLAACHCLEGSFQATVASLQRAIARGSYSVQRAFRDVVFRPYWTVPAFIDGLKPMLGEDDLETPFSALCPPHRVELEVRNSVHRLDLPGQVSQALEGDEGGLREGSEDSRSQATPA